MGAREILSLFIAVTFCSHGQAQNNRYERFSKKEFSELQANKDNLVPKDLGDTIIIVAYTGQKLLEMQTHARNLSYARNGTDTTGSANDPWYNGLTREQVESRITNSEKFAVWYPNKLSKQLKKKGKPSIIVDERELKKNPGYLNKYWLLTTYVSDQKSPDHVAWVMTITNMFYDPRGAEHFEIFLPVNYELLDLVE